MLVVGGGIAGMQASLDLADAGFKVYLVEKKSAIGGHMAQLDKTFPTNDCAMCTISPRLVEVSRHMNVELITDSEITTLEGEAGNFTATIATKPRFIDVDTCNGCSKCAEVCPIPYSNPFDMGLGKARAAHKLYPQATPDAFAIEKRGVAPCRDACPAGQRAQGYIALIAAGRVEDAYRSIKEDNPFPAICGRICNARCEDACTRGKVDEPVSIRALKRYVTDTIHAQPRVAPAPAERKFKQRVAIVGSGPCGLTAAQDLCLQGYGVTVFEALPVAGGMLRVGVPEYRLPATVIEREIQDILDLGVELRLNTPVKQLDDLFAEGFDSVLIAVGAHEGIRMDLPGNQLDGVLINTDFLRDARLWEHDAVAMRAAGKEHPAQLVAGKRVVVIGGGDVAIDVARTSVRFGATSVTMAVRGSSGKMPANPHEVAAAREEGIAMHIGLDFLRVVDDGNGRVAGLEVQDVERFEKNAEGRRVAVIKENSQHVLPADVIVFSVGQKAGLAFIPDHAGIRLTKSREVDVDKKTYATERPGVFAAGDAVTGTAFVIDAVASGHRCADAIGRYLRGEEMAVEPPRDPRVATIPQAELDDKLRRGVIRRAPRVPEPGLPVQGRLGNFSEVQQAYTREQAMAEAYRCLSCGVCSECNSCVWECGVKCIDLNMRGKERQINVGAVVMAPGFRTYQAEQSQEFGLGRYKNVMTSIQYERLLSASGPTAGKLQRPSDKERPKKIAFLQCVGSRDQSHDYCSAVCCMYAAKEAFMTLEQDPTAQIRIFMMDMRAFSKNYESYYQRVREREGIAYTRCRISSIKENPANGNLLIRYFERAALPGGADEGAGTTPELKAEEFDLVVLSVGMEIAPEVRAQAQSFGVELDHNGFCRTRQYQPLATSREGIYAIGPFREPRDIADTIVEASGAAAVVGSFLTQVRDTQTKKASYPEAKDVSGEDPKIAVFVCHCGKNIASVVDVKSVREYAATLPNVVHTEQTIYACSADSIQHISRRVKEVGANRLIIASCSPLTHSRLFENSLKTVGMNPYLFDMANIRNHCSWVHAKEKDKATAKAKDLVRMSTARSRNLQPLTTEQMPMTKSALIIGGGAAGMTSALALADQGFPVVLVEQSDRLGGNLRQVHFGLEPWGAGAGLPAHGEAAFVAPAAYLDKLVAAVEHHPRIAVHLRTELASTKGFMGNFTSTLQPAGTRQAESERIQIEHGVAILATGGSEYKGDEYGYGTSSNIHTGLEFEQLLARHAQGKAEAGERLPDSLAIILCVGPADKYCARICCSTALKQALVLKQLNPQAQVTVLYKDIRTYGFKERLYTAAREAGVLFIQYDDAHKPEVSVEREGAVVRVKVWESILGRAITLNPEALLLSSPIVPSQAAQQLSDRLKIQLDSNGFFLEAHVKLRPVDFSSEGVFMAGIAHYPKLLEESIVQAHAAAARAASLLSKDTITTGGKVAVVDPTLCVGCLTCVRSCAYGAPSIDPDLPGVGAIPGAATIRAALCQGCGVCAASCPQGAIEMLHSTNAQLRANIDALFEPTPAEPAHVHA
ncbi:MAG: FAD-dependent oxidoreductase [Gammaproteobacteria bacterium]|nr:FAD-dependent oxidoreductase [Gammaproteobacteria bacterium]